MATILQRVREFIPQAGNKDRPDDQAPIKVFLRSVDVYTKQTHLLKFKGKNGEQLMDDMMSEKGSKEIKAILDKVFVRFENLDVTDEPPPEEVKAAEAEHRPVKTPDPRAATLNDVWSMGEWALTLEIFMNVINHSQLSKADTKNSNSQSGSLPIPEEAVH
jgi:hypothetical protein